MAQIRRSLLLPLSAFLLTPSFSKSVELANPTHSHENQTQETRGGNGAASISFQWMSPTRDRALLEKVKTAFAGELKPDAKGDASPDAIHYRYLGRVGVSGNMALVVTAIVLIRRSQRLIFLMSTASISELPQRRKLSQPARSISCATSLLRTSSRGKRPM